MGATNGIYHESRRWRVGGVGAGPRGARRRGARRGDAVAEPSRQASRVYKRIVAHNIFYIPRFSGAGGDSITGSTLSTFFSTRSFMRRRGVAKGASRK